MHAMGSQDNDFFGPRFCGRRYLRFAELVELGIAPNRPTLERWVARGQFPRPLRIGRTVFWDMGEVRALLEQRAAARAPVAGETAGILNE